jgi:hypothetical protein
MTTDNFCFTLQNRLIQTGQTGGQLYSDTSHISVPWTGLSTLAYYSAGLITTGDNFVAQERFLKG